MARTITFELTINGEVLKGMLDVPERFFVGEQFHKGLLVQPGAEVGFKFGDEVLVQ